MLGIVIAKDVSRHLLHLCSQRASTSSQYVNIFNLYKLLICFVLIRAVTITPELAFVSKMDLNVLHPSNFLVRCY